MQLFPSPYLNDVALYCLRLSLVFIQAIHEPSNIGILSNTCHLTDSDLHLNISASHLTSSLHIPTHFNLSHSLSPIVSNPIPFIPAYPHPIIPHPIPSHPIIPLLILFSSLLFISIVPRDQLKRRTRTPLFSKGHRQEPLSLGLLWVWSF